MAELVLTANAGDGSISVLALDREAGSLRALTTTGGLPGCGTFAIDAERGLVLAAYKGDPAGIATLHLDRESGTLTELARRPVEGSLTYLTLAHEGRFLLGASYGAGRAWVWPLSQGVVGEPVAEFGYRNLHCIVADGDQVYAVSLGEDLIAQFTLGADGTLTPLQPPVVQAPDGSGPRHLVLDGPNAYVMTEFTAEALRFVRDPQGRLSLVQSAETLVPDSGLRRSAFGLDPKVEPLIWGADLWVAAADGARVLLTSERSTSTITTTDLGLDGELGEVTAYSPTEAQPRGFTVTGDGTLVVAVGERSSHAALSRLEPDGSLTLLDRAEIGAGANWVRVLG